MTLEKLTHPPIVEVICGLYFSTIADLDPLVLGAYWQQRRQEYPAHALHPPLPQSQSLVQFGMPTPRTWFISGDDSLVLQVQQDRLYVNWRARGGAYPRFSSRDGMRARTMREFELFSAFCRQSLGVEPTVLGVEVGKIDHFPWIGTDDLRRLMPSVAGWLDLTRGAEPNVGFRLDESDAESTLRLLVGLAILADEPSLPRVVRMETTATRAVTASSAGAIGEALDLANERVNTLFARLVPAAERNQRFGASA